MQDYSKLYKRKFDETESQRVVRKIRQVFKSNMPPVMMLVTILYLVEKK